VNGLLCWLIELGSYLFQDPGSHLVSTIKDDMELLCLLHLLQKWLGIFALRGQLSDLQTNVVSWRCLDQLLQSNQTCRQRGHILRKRNCKDAARSCLICCHFLSIHDSEEATKNIWIQVFSAEKRLICLPNPQSIDPPTHAWQANKLLQTYQEN